MRGTFKPGDKLIIEKIPYKRIKKGDLIVFGRKGGDEDDFVVHRVVDTISNSLVTRGDNCSGNDKDLASEEIIVGRVIEFDRLGKVRKARNGRIGALRAAMLHGRLQLSKSLKFFLKKPYLIIRKSGLIAKIWQPEIDVFQFETSNGLLVKYVHNDRTVAICWAGENRWWLKRPYDLVLRPK
ncbi:MAG: S26 family signal peptidase [Desulfobacterales bacterium]